MLQGSVTVLVLVLALLFGTTAIMTVLWLSERKRPAHQPAAQGSPGGLNADRRLLESLLDLLPSDSGAIDFLRHGDPSRIRSRILDDLHTFAYDWDNAQHEFHDQDLETHRAKLMVAVHSYLGDMLGPDGSS